MTEKELEYITWFDSPCWSSNVMLGTKGVYYRFAANWNNRNDCWSISISLDDHVLIEGVHLTLFKNPLDFCHSPHRPDCILFPATDNRKIERISYDNMVSGEAKLYHIPMNTKKE